ncbi:MAG: pilus assembly protein PilM [Kiritimatiellia bacterium]
MPRTRNIVGLDIGTRTVRAVWMQLQGTTPRVLRVESFALPLDAPDASQLIRSWLSKVGLNNAFCAVGLSGGSTIFQPGRIPHSDPRTPQQAAAMDLIQFNEMAGDTMRYDVHAFHAPSEPGHTLYLLSMARPVAIERMLQSAQLLGVRPADLIPSSVALYNALEPLAGPHTQPWVYLDIGHQQTDVAIGFAAGLLFARSVPIGGRAFTDAVATAASLSPTQAEARKHADGGLDDPTLGPALTAVADRWTAQVNSCLGVYRNQFSGSAFAPGQVVLTGGGAQLRGLVAHLSAQLRIPAMHAADLPGAASAPDTRLWLGSADLAAGLATTALESVPARVSLLPAKLRDEIVFKEKKGYWVAAAVFVALALGLFTAYGFSAISEANHKMRAEQKRLQYCEELARQIKEKQALCDQIRTRAEPVLQILSGGPLARDTLTLVANSINTNDWISLFCDEASYLPQAAETTPPKTPPRRSPFALFRDLRAAAPAAATRSLPPPPIKGISKPNFIIEGYTPDPSLGTVKEMLKRLRTATLIAKADLLADDRVLPPREIPAAEAARLPPYRRFVIQLEVNLP